MDYIIWSALLNLETPRREFLRRSTGAGAVVAAATALGGVHVFAADQPATVRLGVIGCGNIMTHHLRGLAARGEKVSLEWLCDVDPKQIDMAAGLISGFQSTPIRRTARYEDVLEDSDVDACIIATPHHCPRPRAKLSHRRHRRQRGATICCWRRRAWFVPHS